MAHPVAVQRAMLSFEEHGADRGWDARPALAMMVRPPEMRDMLGEGLGLAEIPVPNEMWSETGANLLQFGLNFAFAPDHPATVWFTKMMADSGFIGIALCNEIWMRAGMSNEEHDRYERNEIRSIADIPPDGEVQTVEARQVFAVDLDGSVHWVVRRRGEEPGEVQTFAKGDPHYPTGRVVKALRPVAIPLRRIVDPELATAVAADPDDPDTKLLAELRAKIGLPPE